MPNPFPGMDPYLEGTLWPTVHGNLIEEIARQLAPKLQPNYFTLTNRRVTVATPDPLELGPSPARLPDIGVFPETTDRPAGVAAASSAPLVLVAAMPEPIEQSYVEIYDAEERNLVTAIEVLSMTNKRGDGLAEFRAKRQQMVAGKAHYIEIDLLRAGERFPMAQTLPSVPYFVFLSRANRRPRIEVWPIPLDQRLPEVHVPLLPGDADVQLDLQSALATVYDLFRYDRAANHRRPLPIPLSPEQSAWAAERLRAAGLL